MGKKIYVLIVDDSSNILSSGPDIEVMAMASNPFVVASKMRQQVPDVITLDVEMHRTDGITFLRK